MSSYEQRMQDTYAAATGVGWVGVRRALVAGDRRLQRDRGHRLAREEQALSSGLFWGRPFWGVVFLVLGGVTLYAGFGVLTRMAGARVIAIFVTLAGGFAEMLWAAGPHQRTRPGCWWGSRSPSRPVRARRPRGGRSAAPPPAA